MAFLAIAENVCRKSHTFIMSQGDDIVGDYVGHGLKRLGNTAFYWELRNWSSYYTCPPAIQKLYSAFCPYIVADVLWLFQILWLLSKMPETKIL